MSKAKPIYILDFALKDVDNNSNKLSFSKFKDKPFFMTFFSVGCGFCKTMLDDLKCVKEELSGKVDAIAVGLDGSPKEMKNYIKKQKLNFNAVIANQALVDRLGGIASTPYTYLVDKYGNIFSGTPGTMDCTDIIRLMKEKGFVEGSKKVEKSKT